MHSNLDTCSNFYFWSDPIHQGYQIDQIFRSNLLQFLFLAFGYHNFTEQREELSHCQKNHKVLRRVRVSDVT